MKALIVLSAAAIFATAIFATSTAAADRPAVESSDKSAVAARAKFESLDRDRDGALNKREAKLDTSIATQFDSWDINLDGYITRAEYMAYTERTTRPQSSQQ